jgi:hypothetical protein
MIIALPLDNECDYGKRASKDFDGIHVCYMVSTQHMSPFRSGKPQRMEKLWRCAFTESLQSALADLHNSIRPGQLTLEVVAEICSRDIDKAAKEIQTRFLHTSSFESEYVNRVQFFRSERPRMAASMFVQFLRESRWVLDHVTADKRRIVELYDSDVLRDQKRNPSVRIYFDIVHE